MRTGRIVSDRPHRLHHGPPFLHFGATMKVTRITSRVVRTPANNILVEGIAGSHITRELVTLELDTDQAITGIGLTLFGGPLIAALKAAVDALAQFVLGQN